MRKLMISPAIACLFALCQGAASYADDPAASTAASPVATLAHEWDQAQFAVTAHDAQLAALEAVADHANALLAGDPENADYMVWRAIALSSEAGVIRGPSALGRVREARELLERAEVINPQALGDASIYSSLGSLYYQVPGFPISFGNRQRAQAYLEQAVQQAPTGIDPNYFMADFLVHEHDYRQAVVYLDRADAAPRRAGRELADNGRREQVAELRAIVVDHLGDSSSTPGR